MVEISRGLRAALAFAGVAVGYASFVLFVFPDRSEDLFAWDIQPPVTAAFFGAFYATAIPLLFLLARPGTRWWQVRPVLPALFTLSTTMLIATALHDDKFLWDRVVAWLWLVLYLVYPPMIAAFYLSHRARDPGPPPVATAVRPWLRPSSIAAAAATGGLGAALFLWPTTVDALWPWTLTPLTARVVGGWLLFMATALLAMGLERDWAAIRPLFLEAAIVLVLLLVGVARFSEEFDWGSPEAWGYLLAVVGGLVVSAVVFLAHERVPTPRPSRARA
jgi:hypothetical protein